MCALAPAGLVPLGRERGGISRVGRRLCLQRGSPVEEDSNLHSVSGVNEDTPKIKLSARYAAHSAFVTNHEVSWQTESEFLRVSWSSIVCR